MIGPARLEAARAAWAGRATNPVPTWIPPAAATEGLQRSLRRFRDARAQFWAEGRVHWGRMLQGPDRAMRPGSDFLVGSVLWSVDPFVVRNPRLLGTTAARCWAVHNRPETAIPGLRAAAAFLAAVDTPPSAPRQVPPLLSELQPIEVGTIALFREHFPDGRLADAWLFIVTVEAAGARLVVPLPASFWPPDLLDAWRRFSIP